MARGIAGMSLVNSIAYQNALYRRVMLIGSIFFLSLCVVSLVVFYVPLDFLTALCSDDAFYYFKIARNIVGGQGCTFDGIAPTNGFHPVWMILVLAAHYLAGPQLEMPVRMVIAANGLLCIATLLLFYHVARKQVGPGVGVVAVAVCLAPGTLSAMTNGMETGLLLFAMVVLLWLCYEKGLHDPVSNVRQSFLFGALLGAICLCRLDAVFFMLAAVCAAAIAGPVFRLSARRWASRMVALGVGFVVVVSPYLLWNIVAFGHVMPISGAVKSCFPQVRHTLAVYRDMRFGLVLLVILVVLTSIASLIDCHRERCWRKLFRSPLPMLALGCVLHFCHAFLFLPWGVYWWHFGPYGVVMAMALAEVVDRLVAGRPTVRRAAIVMLVPTVCVFAIVTQSQVIRMKYERHQVWLEGAEWARAHTASNAVFAMNDAGLFGYFSDRPVINLDGKANGYEYLKALNERDVEGYLQRANMAYAASIHAHYKGGKFPIVIPRANQPSVVLWMDESSEVYRSRPFRSGRFISCDQTHFTIWAYPQRQIPGCS